MDIRFNSVQTDEFHMDYFCFGNGNKTLVILPGLSVQSVMNVAAAVAGEYRVFATEFTVYVFDRRSDLPPVYNIEEMAHDTACAVEQLGLRDIYLFGASQGGMIAMLIAARHPAIVKKLLLASTAAVVEPQRFSLIRHWCELGEKKESEALYLSFGESIYPEHLFRQYRPLLQTLAHHVTDEELERFLIIANGIQGFDARPILKNICCPVLVLGAADDTVLGADAADVIRRGLCSCETVQMYLYPAGYGHAVYDTADDFRDRMYHFCLE